MITIIDIGLSKLLDGQDLTKSGTTKGTDAYMSPEQALGQPVDNRTDIWSLGVLLYEMLSNQKPFQGSHDPVILYKIVHEKPQPLSTYRRDFPEDLQIIIDNMLAKAKDDRYATMNGVINDLQSLFEEGYLVHSTHQRRQNRFIQRWRSLGLILIAVAAGVWASLAGYRAASYAESPVQLSSTAVAVFPFTVKAAEEFAFLSEGMMDLLSLKLDGAGEVRRVDPPHRLESISTSSSLALKYYLEGESLLRAGKYAVAIGAFKKATNEDSTFAIHTTVLPMPALLKPDSGQREELHSRRLQNMQSRCHGAIAIY